jgi:hypothetical protein
MLMLAAYSTRCFRSWSFAHKEGFSHSCAARRSSVASLAHRVGRSLSNARWCSRAMDARGRQG